MVIRAYLVILIVTLSLSVAAQTPPLAASNFKFVGNVHSTSQVNGFLSYWNQVTPENAGKWGSVEGSRDNMNWSQLDAAYKLAKDNNLPFRLHTLIWGAQQPSWIETLSRTEQREEIEEWFAALAARYPDIDFIDVVNEPLHQPPSGTGRGNYIQALGGSGVSGWDWVLNAFYLARQYFPDAALALNDYGIISSVSSTENYIKIIRLLQEKNLIDAIGVQAHAFSTTVPSAMITDNLNRLALCNLPIYATELDIDGPTDNQQLTEYERIFPLFYGHPFVRGVTLWGWRPGMWRSDQGAYLITAQGTERPSMTFLREYLDDFEDVPVTSVEITSQQLAGGVYQLTAAVEPEDATYQVVFWSIDDPAAARVTKGGKVIPLAGGPVTITATTMDGSEISSTIDLNIQGVVTSVEEYSHINVHPYPNPVLNNKLFLDGVESIDRIRIVDINGRVTQDILVNGRSSVQVEMNVPAGLYGVQLVKGRSVVVRRVFVGKCGCGYPLAP